MRLLRKLWAICAWRMAFPIPAKLLKLYERREFKECMKKQPPGRTFHCLGISSVDERACDGMRSILGGFVR